MARIPYADATRPELQALSAQIAAGRGSVPHLYRMLLHSPPVAEGWLRYLSAIRHECALPVPLALREGLTQTQLDRLDSWEESDLFDARQRAVLAPTDAMTREVHVPNAVFAAATAELDTRTLVEAVATIAAYNMVSMVSRFLEAFQISSQDPV